jgi:hypothetical protein
MLREFDEELRGRSEEYGPGPVDYDSWPFARHMTAALGCGRIRVWCLALGTDPLTYATDLLTVAVIDSRVFDEFFSLAPRGNAEGSVLAAQEFAAHVIDRIVTGEPVQAAGAALLRLAWRHRDILTGLGGPDGRLLTARTPAGPWPSTPRGRVPACRSAPRSSPPR